MYVYRLLTPVDDFEGLIPLNEWIGGDAERTAWALQAVFALNKAAVTVKWDGDMRHVPLVGYLPSPFATRYMIVKQDNNGDSFLICQNDLTEPLWDTAVCKAVPSVISDLEGKFYLRDGVLHTTSGFTD